MDEAEPALSRAFLARGGLEDLLARGAPDLRIWTEAERAASLAEILDTNPVPGQGIWLFAYGSLLWNPTVHVERRLACRAASWHRAFCLVARAGRGTADRPGLLLGLMPGRGCDGVALRVAEADWRTDLTLLWRREMVAGSYVPRWIQIDRPEIDLPAPEAATPGATAPCHAPRYAIAFTIDLAGRNYAGDLAEDEVVQRLATARGELGTCAEYLLRTRAALRASGIEDPDIERLADRVLQIGA